MAAKYYRLVKQTQPIGSCAIMKYSLGSSIAFDIAKSIEVGGQEVGFYAALDSPPHFARLVAPLDWTMSAVPGTTFLNLQPQKGSRIGREAM